MRKDSMIKWAAGAAAAPLLAAGLMAAPPALAASCQPWSGAQPPKPPSTEIADGAGGVAVVSACEVWVVGTRDFQTGSVPLMDHWTGGSSWKAFTGGPVPGIAHREGSFSVLRDVAAASATSVWAVGFSDNHNALVEHWNGSHWKPTVLPNPGGEEALNGVTALSPTNVWAVGSALSNGRVLIAHWNGTKWSKLPTPTRSGITDELNGMTARSATDIWAVGDSFGRGGALHTLVEHWNGRAWRIVPSPSPTGGGGFEDGGVLVSVTAVSASNAWAVGSINEKTGARQPLIEHWNGTKWTRVASPIPDAALGGVHAVSANSIWVVGDHQPFGTDPTGLVLHWNGTSWAVKTMPGAAALGSVAGPSGQVWTAGGPDQGNGAFAAPVSAAVPATTSR